MSIVSSTLIRIVNSIRTYRHNRVHFKTIDDMREGVNMVKISKSHKKQIQDFYKKCWGNKINLKWHEYYETVTGSISHKYIPTYIYYSHIYPKLNDPRVMVVYSDKNIIRKLIPDVKLPITYVQCINGHYYIDDKLCSFEDAVAVCNNLKDAVIKHSIDTCQGKSVSRFSSIDGKVVGKDMSVEVLLKSYNDNYIVQEAISQNYTMASLNPTSLNTIRIMTYWSQNDGVVVLFAVVRMGRSGAVVDNASAGGLYCGINHDGSLKEYAYTLYPFSQCEKSDSEIVFKEFRIPYFEELKEKARKMHENLPYAKVIGWDMAINDKNEIVLVEINASCPGLFQAATGPAFGDYTEEILNITRIR